MVESLVYVGKLETLLVSGQSKLEFHRRWAVVHAVSDFGIDR
jgi:hypothetical protein